MKMSPRVISTFLYPFLQINNLILTSSLNHLVKLTSIVFVAYSNDQCLDTFGNPTAVNTVIASLLKYPLLIAHDSISLPFLLSTPNSRPFASSTFLDMPLKCDVSKGAILSLLSDFSISTSSHPFSWFSYYPY